MKTADSVEWFRTKNARRKAELNRGLRKQRLEERKWRRNLLHGAFGKKETETTND